MNVVSPGFTHSDEKGTSLENLEVLTCRCREEKTCFFYCGLWLMYSLFLVAGIFNSPVMNRAYLKILARIIRYPLFLAAEIVKSPAKNGGYLKILARIIR